MAISDSSESASSFSKAIASNLAGCEIRSQTLLILSPPNLLNILSAASMAEWAASLSCTGSLSLMTDSNPSFTDVNSLCTV